MRGDNSWLIGVCAGERAESSDLNAFPRRWYFFDRQAGKSGSLFRTENMVDTGMTFKPGVVYSFSIVVYPKLGRYDAAICDDERTFVQTGLRFRSGKKEMANVIHFGANASQSDDRLGFSLDSIRIEPWRHAAHDPHALELTFARYDSIAALDSNGEVDRIETKAGDGYSGIWYSAENADKTGEHVSFSGGLGTFPHQHVPMAVYCEKAQKTYFVYGGVSGRQQLLHMISYYDHATGKLARPRVLDDKQTVDAQDGPTLTVDAAGYLWVFSNSHGVRMRPAFIWKSTEPYSISSFERIVTTNFAYGQPWSQPSGDFVLLHTRYGEGRDLFQMHSRDGRTWSVPKPLAAIENGQYQISWQHQDRLGTIFNYHPKTTGINGRTNLYYMESSDGGSSWCNAAGEKLNLPLREKGNHALAVDYQRTKQLVYLKDLAFTATGQPVALYLTSYGWKPGPDSSPREFATARWTGSDWQIRPVTTTDHNYDHASLYLEADGTWRMIGATGAGPEPYETGGEIEMWLSHNEGESWSLEKRLTANSQFNHSYPRRPLNAHPDFYAFWADGSAREPSSSRLYFCSQDGHVYRMPERIGVDQIEIEPQLIRE